ncbi:hypothetical protein LTR36_000499 [Oleoguttula mirabilis]|uniref:Galactose oxidase-like Early set domain-containing protein n=1 Tax=Oleoguttula mirabilis TaxID=1507867 RepID=A0AAV9JSM6_9PEZI|nr:hypothetical protein LTR36_000499 [Oleoguttula mirabilis]
MGDRKIIGQWDDPFTINNVACHATLLPTGKILCWGRRTNPMSVDDTMNEQKTSAFLINMEGPSRFDVKGVFPTCTPTKNQPQLLGTKAEVTESNVNIFCSGHCLQPDGNLFVVGGHFKDGWGMQYACVYNTKDDKWTPTTQVPRVGRWYPSALALPDSGVLTISGSQHDYVADLNPEIFRVDKSGIFGSGKFETVQSPSWDLESLNQQKATIIALYPRLHLDPTGRVFMAGPSGESAILDVSTVSANVTGNWIPTSLKRETALRGEGASVTYDSGKVLWCGGGHDQLLDNAGKAVLEAGDPVPGRFDKAGKPVLGPDKPVPGPGTKNAETIDLNVGSPKWEQVSPMKYKRRHHNLTTLPDGTVLVTGGTSGPRFNDLAEGSPVHFPELWNPPANGGGGGGTWTELAPEACDRCYHGVALLLPDGSVLSAGSGEGGSPWKVPNPIRDNSIKAQRFKPPYFFIDGNPPQITGVPKETKYGQKFTVVVKGSDQIKRISWIRLPSVTHCTNSSQSVVFVVFNPPKPPGATIEVTTPRNRNAATPGYYMLFFVNKQGRPSVASIIWISPEKTKDEWSPPKPAVSTTADIKKPSARMAQVVRSIPHLNESIIAQQEEPAVMVGLTPSCPYGLGPCWAGAFEGLHSIKDIAVVRPLPDQDNSVAFVYLKEDKVPDIDEWREQFAQSANGSYGMRGIQLTLSGVVVQKQFGDGDKLLLVGTATRPEVVLAPFKPESILEHDHKAGVLKPVSDQELSAYPSLHSVIASTKAEVAVNVTGRLNKHGANDFSLDVREFEVIPAT